MKKIIYSLIAITILFSCTNDSVDDLLEPIPTTPLVAGTPISFNTNIKPIMTNNCVACHTSPPINGAPFALVTYNDVVTSANNTLIERISKQPSESGFMPVGGTRLPQNLIDMITLWKTEGY